MIKTSSLKVGVEDVWALQQFVKHDMTTKLPRREEVPAGFLLREKVNDAILRFADEDDLKELELDLIEEELWLIDLKLPLAYAGARPLLLRVFQCLWDLGYILPAVDSGCAQ